MFPKFDTFTILILLLLLEFASSVLEIDVDKTRIWGPGLQSRFFMPVRYFYIQPVAKNGEQCPSFLANFNCIVTPVLSYGTEVWGFHPADDIECLRLKFCKHILKVKKSSSNAAVYRELGRFSNSVGEKPFDFTVTQPGGQRARVWAQVFDLHNGSYIARFKLFESYQQIKLVILHNGQNVADSPYHLNGMVYHEKCNCPVPNIDKWYKIMDCPSGFDQIDKDLAIFKQVDLDKVAKEAVSRFSSAGMHSLCHYKIIDNKIYRKTHGEHVGFKMFSDAILLSITRKVKLPDIEFFVNLGDWPLEKKKISENPIPIFSWCGSDETLDIVMPTYDLTEATLEMMGRVTLDIISVQGNTGPSWENKTEKAFWRGRDARQERLDLVIMSRENPHLIDAALTHMFFFPKDEKKYGELVKSISFFDFFKYKYQLNIDGTVAAYRFPYLLAGDAVVFKQNSNYYEHFYKSLKPNIHYIPFKRDLSDLQEKIKWAKSHDKEVRIISQNAQKFVRKNLMPEDVFCYHVKLFDKFSKLLKYKPSPPDDKWELVEQPNDNDSKCDCKRTKKNKQKKDEL